MRFLFSTLYLILIMYNRMRLPVLLSFIVWMLFACNRPSDKLYMPAEWEPHDAVWLGWQKGEDRGFYPSIAQLIQTLAPHVTVKIACDSDSLMLAAKEYLFNGQKLDSTNIRFYVMPGDRYWIRDHGAAFLVNEQGELGVADFDFRMYGLPLWLMEKFDGNKDSVDARLGRMSPQLTTVDSQMAVAEGAKILKANIIHEGGSIEVNGKGTLILCEAVALSRNPGKSKTEIEAEFKRVLGVTNIIWMKEGLADDPNWSRKIEGKYYGWGTGGHTDEFVRFADANTILLAWVDEAEKDKDPIASINFERMNENLRILEASADQDGKPFNIIKVPLPDLTTKALVVVDSLPKENAENFALRTGFLPKNAPAVGDTIFLVPASSYLNYLITNNLVVLPTYKGVGSSELKEKKVEDIFKKLYPERQIVFLDFMAQNWSGGGIHCSTQQQPSRKK
jgi:agmatine deiminase